MDERIAERMRELDAQLASNEPPPRLERRVLATISEPRALPSALVLAGVVAALVLAFWLGRRTVDIEPQTIVPVAVAPTEVAPADAAPIDVAPIDVAPIDVAPIDVQPLGTPTLATLWSGSLVPSPGCRVVGDDELQIEAGCTADLRTPALAITTWSSTRMQRRDDGVHMIEGEALFSVQSVAPGGRRVRVEVAAGAIEVLGTRFAVTQRGDDGHVDLLEGSIAFVDLAGTTHAVQPGHRLQWSDGVVVVIPPPRTTTTSKPTSAAHTDALDKALEQVAALRRAGKWSDAIALLHRARRAIKDGAAAEILSYEEGTLRAHEDDVPAMCAYWRGHLARFGEGVHAPGARTQLERTGCGDP